jgi:large subunit ribosomal protein L4
VKIKAFDGKGLKIEDIEIKSLDLNEEFSSDLLLQYLRIYQTNQRQGTSKVKTKSEVRGGGKKPYKQKGTGRARAGSSRSPLWRGGGVVHGPIPKDWSLSFTKKLIKKALKRALILKAKENKLVVISYTNETNKYSTKDAVEAIKNMKIDGKVLLIQHNDDHLFKSFRNIEMVEVAQVTNFNAYDVYKNEFVIVEKSAIDSFEGRL